MTQATDTDIRDIKTSIDNLTKATESIARSTEANTKSIGDLTLSVSSLREETRVGFANVTTQITRLDGRIDTLEAKLDSKIDNLETKLDAKIDNLEIRIDGRFDLMTAKLENIDINAKNTVDLAEKIGELKNWKQIAIVTFTASVSGAITWYIRSGNP
jgi:chromosome segregation ATPase